MEKSLEDFIEENRTKIRNAFKQDIEWFADRNVWSGDYSRNDAIDKAIEEINNYSNEDFFEIMLQSDIEIYPYINVNIDEDNNEEKTYSALWKIFKEVADDDYDYGFWKMENILKKGKNNG